MTMVSDFSPRRAAAIEARGRDFEMRTNIKARPNSQGTLFQGGKPTAQHRWVRGYSPSRMAAVGGALTLGGGGIHITADPRAGDPESPELSHPHFNPASEQHTRRLMLEPLARSTYSVPDITNLAGGIHLRITPGTRSGEAAHYSPQTRTINVNRQVQHGTPHEQIAKADAVLMHEMGHHVDITQNALGYDMQSRMHPMGFEGIRGNLEHNADAAMIEHFRNDPRNQRRTGLDVKQLTYGGRGKGHLAGVSGYTDPGEESDESRRERSFALKRERHHEKTGEVATQSPLHPGQFKNDVQGVLF